MQDCTKSIMVSEIERGKLICGASNARQGGLLDFVQLTEAFNFFGPGSYGNYLQVIVAASSTEDFVKWSGYMNSRVKHFTARMHNMHGQLLARPWPKEFKVPMCARPRQARTD
jgi:poly(A) polymerase